MDDRIFRMNRKSYTLFLLIIVVLLTSCTSVGSNKINSISMSDVWVDANRAYMAQKWNDAQSLYEKLTEAFPSDSEAHFRLGVSAYRQGNAELAEKSFSHVVNLEPNNSKAMYNLAVLQISSAYSLLKKCAINASSDVEREKYLEMIKNIETIK